MTGTLSTLTDTVCTEPEQNNLLLADFTRRTGLVVDNVDYDWYVAPDGGKGLALVETTSPTTVLKLGDWNPEPQPDTFYQGWIAYADGREPRLIFQTVEKLFLFRWTPDSRYLVLNEFCYGGPGILTEGIGLLAIDASSATTYVLSDSYSGACEGSVAYQIASDSQHLIYEPGIVTTLDGAVQVRVCGEQEWARSYTWSQDGRYAYLSCYVSPDETDTLRRYDVLTGENRVLVPRDCLAFKSIDMAISPDQTHLAFSWGTSNFIPLERYGIWVVDLTKLGDCQ